MGQVAEMWRNQLLCDAIIRTGTTDTKAHRLVLVAACPMLQTMENAAIGSHLEVRLSPEIKQESVQTFLKYLYEGFMMLTGENYKDVEKIAKILQVESIVRCCVDFSKCLSEKTGVPCEKRFGLSENSDSVYVRSSDLLKVQETVKRHSEEETVSPEGERKRQKINRPTPPPPLLLPMHNLANNERVSSHGIDMSRVSDTDRLMEAEYLPQVIQSSRSSTSEAEIIKDSLEIVHREPPDPNNINQPEPPVQQTMGLSVASKIPSDRNTQIVNMSNALPHSRASSSKNLHIQSSPHSSSSSRKPETAHSLESEPRTPETHKNHDRRHLLTGETYSRHHARQNSHEMPPRKHESYPSNLPTSEILGTQSLHDLSSRSISSPSAVSSQPSSPYRHPIPLSHRQINAAQIQKASFLQPLFRPGLPYDGRSYAGVPIGSLSNLAGLLPTSMAPPLPMSYGAEDSIKDHGSGPSVPNSPCTPSGPDLSIIKSEEPHENEELHIDIPEESSTSGAASPHNITEEEPPGDDSSNQGSDGGSLWQDNSVKAQFSHDKYQLWEFIRDLLHDPKYNPSIIQWENILDGVFRIVDSAEVARLWGKTKKFTKMTYDHMGRAFRYSKTMGYFAELPKGAGYPKKLCFKFGPKAHNWLPFPNTEAPLNLVLKPKVERRKPTEKRSNESILEKSSGFMRRMSELGTEQMSRKSGRKSVSQERALIGMTKDTYRFGMDLGSAESIYRFQTGSEGTPFPPDRPPEMTYNIPSFIEKSEDLSVDLLDGPKQKDQFSRERSRRASAEETIQETDSLLLLARASTAESSATSPRSSSTEKQTSFDSPEHNQK